MAVSACGMKGIDRPPPASYVEGPRASITCDTCSTRDTVHAVDIGAKIRDHRMRAKLSQAALARAAKVGRLTVIRAESGTHRPSLSTLERLAKALGVKVKDLLE